MTQGRAAPVFDAFATDEVRGSSTTVEPSFTVISVDDHLVEPRHMFEGRLPARLADRAPYVKTTSQGHEIWVFDGQAYPQVGLNAVVGRSKDESPMEPVRFDEMRRGCWDPDARVADMDLAGIWASVGFPSQITGFCGSVYSSCSDASLGQACVRAWNDWFWEEWWSPHPERFVPLGITWLADPEVAAAEIRRNAARGFRAVTLPEQPHRLGYPSLYSGWWDPVLAACAESGTVVCVHVGSSGMPDQALDGPLVEVAATLFSSQSLIACVDWLWSGVAVRFPELHIAMSEGGIGWVPMLADRLDYVHGWSGHGRRAWPSTELTPTEVLLRNFWFCSLDDPSIWPIRDRIGVDHVMVEVDYPHADSTWPATQSFLADRLAGLPVDEQRRVTHANAAALFRHPLPESPRP
ncbi:MAG: amidohydrolase family protein [Acidimicrobiales bacterium]